MLLDSDAVVFVFAAQVLKYTLILSEKNHVCFLEKKSSSANISAPLSTLGSGIFQSFVENVFSVQN